jgi:hypothetical protein
MVGHSIGCKIIMEVLKRNEDEAARILKSYLLFPTLERMRLTPNGKFLWYFSSVRWLTTTVVWPFSVLPFSIQRAMVSLYFYGRTTTDCVKKASMELFNREVFKRFVTMGFSELEQVFELDVETVEKLQDSLYFYFGTSDGWCPLHFATEMKALFPNMKHKICDKNFDHAFVISSSLEMASVLVPLFTADVLSVSTAESELK